MSHACHLFWKCYKPSRFAHFWQGAESLAPAKQNHTWTFKSGRACAAFNILTLKCASRHDSMHFFNISPATSAPTDSRARYLDVIAFWHGLSQRGATVFSTVSLLFLLDGFVRKQISRKAECPTFSCFCKHHDTAYSAFQRLLNAYDISFFPKVPEHRRAFSTKMLARSCKILQASSL
jgi:hypothetical protein